MSSTDQPRPPAPPDGAAPGAATPEQRPPARRRPRRRLLRLLGVVLVLLVALVVGAPTLLSTAAGRGFLVSQINGRIRGQVALDELSLGWLSDNSAGCVRVQDPAGREVLRVENLSIAKGLLPLALRPVEFGVLTIDRPQVTLVSDAQHRLSLAEAFAPRTPVPPSGAAPPEPQGVVVIGGGRVLYEPAGSTAFDVTGLAGSIDCRTLADIRVALDAQVGLRSSADAAALPAGALHLHGGLDLRPADPRLRVGASVAVLERVPLTTELARHLLSWLNPLFFHLAAIEGRVDLTLGDVDLPLSAAIRSRGRGLGQLDLEAVRLRPAGWADELVELLNLPARELIVVHFERLAFELRDGRVHYDNLTMKFAGDVEVQFRGSVGLDGTLALVAALPVREGLVQRLGVQGRAPDVARRLSGLRIDVPLAGTREHPRFDFAQVDVQSLIGESLVPALPGLLRGLGEKPPEPERPRKR